MSARGRTPGTLALGALLTAITVMAAAKPSVTIAAARVGADLWWHALLPALLPFLILCQLLTTTGVTAFFGVLLEPVMRPLFAVPGAGGFVLALGLTSGYPVGPRVAASLVEAGLSTREEGERLAAFSNAAGPLFVTGAVATGLFHAPQAGMPLLVTHWSAAILTGMLLGAGHSHRQIANPHATTTSLWRQACRALLSARKKDERPLGELLTAAVREATSAILLIGGFVVLFSVLLALLATTPVGTAAAGAVGRFLAAAGLPGVLAPATVAGVVEVTNGLHRLAALSDVPLAPRLLVAAALLAWSGLSVHAQAYAFGAAQGFRYRVFLTGRVIQAALAVACLAAVMPGVPALAPHVAVLAPTVSAPAGSPALSLLLISTLRAITAIGGCMVAGLVMTLYDAISRRAVLLTWRR